MLLIRDATMIFHDASFHAAAAADILFFRDAVFAAPCLEDTRLLAACRFLHFHACC